LPLPRQEIRDIASCPIQTPLLLLPDKGSSAFARGYSSVGGDFDDEASIVGLWQFVFTSKGNDVAPFLIHETIDQYDAAIHWMFHLTGTVSAHRITAD
jgi:hypothetical protein